MKRKSAQRKRMSTRARRERPQRARAGGAGCAFLIRELRASGLKAKEVSEALGKAFIDDSEYLKELVDDSCILTDLERAVLMEALEYATDIDPEVVEPVLDVVFDCLGYEAPRVKYAAAKVVGNVAHRFPEAVFMSAPVLLKNARHSGTSVRSSAAYALGEIARHNAKMRGKLMPEIHKAFEWERDHGVRAVYKKALRDLA